MTGVVVTVSVVLHGASATSLSALYGRAVERATHEEERESTAAGIFGGAAKETPRISVEELAEQLEDPNPPLVLDVRSTSGILDASPGSIRVMPDTVEDW